MYSYIKGKLVLVSTDYIVVDNNSIGYKITVPFNEQIESAKEGDEITVHTFLNATENGITLYGFFNEEDRELFFRLTSVSGVGPKNAISILSTLTYRDIIFSILNNDDKSISKAPGVGPKIAKRIILELKDKLDISEDTLLNVPVSNDVSVDENTSSQIKDAISALCALGYPYNDALKAVKSIENSNELEVEELLSLALREM